MRWWPVEWRCRGGVGFMTGDRVREDLLGGGRRSRDTGVSGFSTASIGGGVEIDRERGVVKAEVSMVGVTDDDPVGSLLIIVMIRATVRPILELPTPVGCASCHCGSS
ncbi:hypothetical protein SO802_028547 [Lithocarpus litseifolius]|uniref:Uncharacterized protein n=1 Tax=Lithocarpus litseifolius TaxID=425828 RepID=A0AAW2BSH0_9ROSI